MVKKSKPDTRKRRETDTMIETRKEGMKSLFVLSSRDEKENENGEKENGGRRSGKITKERERESEKSVLEPENISINSIP